MLGSSELSIAATSAAAIAIVFVYFWRKLNGTKDAGRQYPPSSPVLPLISAVCRGGMAAMPELFMKSAEKLGPVISYNFGGRLVVILNGKEAITEACLKKSEAFADRAEFWVEANVLNKHLKGFIFAKYNETFKQYQKLCLTILKEFGFGVKSDSEARILREVESLEENILKYNGRQFDPKLLAVHATFNVMSNIIFGETFFSRSACQKISEAVPEFALHTNYTINIAPFLRFLPKCRDELSVLSRCHEVIIKGIEEGIECSKSTEGESTFVRRFIEIQGPDYDRQDLIYIIRDLCFASSDTASTSLTWALVELANHPEVQSRFQQELDDVVSRDRFPSLDDQPLLPYTEAVILEVMRRHTVVPFYVPHATLRDAELMGYFIPKGSMVLANALSAHMDKESWKDPENFRPQRFLDDDMKIIGGDKVIAFGLGKRSCLGEILGRQKVFLFLTSLVQRFDIRPPEGQSSINVREIVGGILRPSEYEVRLIPRTKDRD